MRFPSSLHHGVLVCLTLASGAVAIVACGGDDGGEVAGPVPGAGGHSLDAASEGGAGGTAGSDASAGGAGKAGASGAAGKDAASDVVQGSTQCGICTKDTDCASGYKCVTSPLGDQFCALDCASAACPSAEYECVDLSSWGQDAGTDGAAGGAPEPDASDDASASDASAAGAGGSAPSLGKACVPTGGGTCPCTAAREGVVRTCFSSNQYGTCAGTETCKSGSWQGCDAVQAQKEICDQKDNNCNGFVDMDEPGITGNQLCAGGLAPPHSGFSCVMGSCELSGCEPGWTKYPPSTPQTDGCNCPIDADDQKVAKNDSCATATDQGSIVDVGSQPKVVQGTLSSDADVDWYAITATDQNETPVNNSFWVKVEFQSPDGNPADEYQFELIRSVGTGDSCDGTKAKSELTSYDWCANSNTSTGAANADSTAKYRLKVFRKTGATPTCKPYKLKVSNGGASAGCPADDGCGT